MITCETAKEYISLKLDNELDKDSIMVLDEHLLACHQCQQYEEDLQKLDQILSYLPEVKMEGSIVDLLITEGKLPSIEQPTIEQSTTEYKSPTLKESNNTNAINFENHTGKFESKNSWSKSIGLKPWHKTLLVASLMLALIPIYYLANTQYMSSESSQEKSMQMAITEAPIAESKDQQLDAGENMGITGFAVEDSAQNNEASMKEMSDSNASLTSAPVYQVAEEEHQLVVIEQEREIYRTAPWDAGLRMEWQFSENNSNIIIYSLYDQKNQLVAKYQIDLVKKTEEKIAEK